VLCGTCHERTHGREPEAISVRLYVKLASEMLDAGLVETAVDLSDALKVRCVQLRVPYDGPKIHDAIAVLMPRLRPQRTRPPQELPPADERELTKAEAALVLSKIQATLGVWMVKTMPRVEPFTWKQERDPYAENPNYVAGSDERY
jgi:hypothetical protein